MACSIPLRILCGLFHPSPPPGHWIGRHRQTDKPAEGWHRQRWTPDGAANGRLPLDDRQVLVYKPGLYNTLQQCTEFSGMANIKSAMKRIRQDAKRTERNKARRSRVRTYVKQVEVAIAAGNGDDARTALVLAQKELDRAAGKGLIKRNNASRKVSRLNARVKALAAA